MIKCVIVDDELKSRESLKKMLLTFCDYVEVCATCQNVDEGIGAIEKFHPAVLFLDVQMQRETGFDLLAKIKDISFDIIFTTAHAEYAIKAIKYSAIDYLLKPIDVDELLEAIDKVEKKQNTNTSEKVHQLIQNLKTNATDKYKLALPTSEGLAFIKINDIIYCRASGNYTEIFMTDTKKHLVSRQLKEYDDLLSDQHFFRIHHSYLVNLNYISNYIKGDGGYVVMSDGTSLDVSRRKKDAFLEHIGYKF